VSRRILSNLAEGSPPNSHESVFSFDSLLKEGGRRQRASAACHEFVKWSLHLASSDILLQFSARRLQCLRCQRLRKERVYKRTPTENPRQWEKRKYDEFKAR
ncbi:hypothetical protein EV126DRAFT_334959, partial [Verticillium dahliae]